MSWLRSQADPVRLAGQHGGLLGILVEKGMREWKHVCPVADLTRPLLSFSGKHPVFLVKNGEVAAYRAQCPVDKSLTVGQKRAKYLDARGARGSTTSFDPCIACAVHLIHPTTNKIQRFTIGTG